MKIQANNMRPGMVIEHQGKQWSIIKIELLQPGKGGAFIQVEMRDILSGNKSNDRWRTQETVEKLEVRERDTQYLYKDGDDYNFMDIETFEQFSLTDKKIGDKKLYLEEGLSVTANTIEGKPVDITLPQTMTFTVIEADAVVKGQTAKCSLYISITWFLIFVLKPIYSVIPGNFFFKKLVLEIGPLINFVNLFTFISFKARLKQFSIY